MAKVRIQKVLAQAGVASRRAIEEMIVDSRIMVNGKLVLALPCFVDPEVDSVTVDDTIIRMADSGPRRYFLLSKPKDVVCTSSDEMGRRRAIDCVPAIAGRLYCVGRLDADSTGLILLTNDGELTQHLTHPKFGVIKTYIAHIEGQLSAEKIDQFKKGVWLDGRKTAGAMIRVLKRAGGTSQLEIRLTEGRNREIRRVLARLGNKVRRLHRSAIGPLSDRGLKVGSWRELSPDEVDKLHKAGGFTPTKATVPTGKSGRAGQGGVRRPLAAAEPTATKAPAAKKKTTGRKKPTVLKRTSSRQGTADTAPKKRASAAKKPAAKAKPSGKSSASKPSRKSVSASAKSPRKSARPPRKSVSAPAKPSRAKRPARGGASAKPRRPAAGKKRPGPSAKKRLTTGAKKGPARRRR